MIYLKLSCTHWYDIPLLNKESGLPYYLTPFLKDQIPKIALIVIGRPVNCSDHNVKECEKHKDERKYHSTHVVHLVAYVRITLQVHLTKEEVDELIEESATRRVPAVVAKVVALKIRGQWTGRWVASAILNCVVVCLHKGFKIDKK